MLGRKRAIFVHGCFWHGHGCKKGKAPKSRLEYWGPKLEANKARDRRNEIALKNKGFEVLTVWQCETDDEQALKRRLEIFLDI